MSESSPWQHEIEQLIWELVDDRITETRFERLKKLLAEDADARRTYLSCIQLHADLHQHFAHQDGQGPPETTDRAATAIPPLQVDIQQSRDGPATDIGMDRC